MKHVKVHSLELKKCEHNGEKVNVLEVIYRYGKIDKKNPDANKLLVRFLGTQEEDIDSDVKQGKEKARLYFKSIENGKK